MQAARQQGGVRTAGAFVRLRNRIFAFAGLFVLALVALQAIAYWNRYEAAILATERRSANLAHTLGAHLRQTVAAADASLRQIAMQAQRIGAPPDHVAEWTTLVDAAFAGTAGVGSISIIDAEGIIRASTMRSLVEQSRADQFLIQQLRTASADTLVADVPFMTGPDRPHWVLPLGRALRDAQGAYLGAVVATLRPAALQELYRSVDVGNEGNVRVLHSSGIAIFVEPAPQPAARPPANDPVVLAYRRGERSGVAHGPIVPGGAAYITAFRTVAPPDLIVAVSIARAAVVGPWLRELVYGAGVALLLAAALLLAVIQLLRHLGARHAAERALDRRDREMAVAQSMAGLGSFVIDYRRATAWLSPSLNGIFGRALDADSLPLEAFLDLVDSDDRGTLRAALRRCADDGVSFRLEFRCRIDNGAPRNFWSQGFRYDDAQHGTAEIVGFCQDVTDRRAAEERLLQAQKMGAIGQLTGGIAHDFNNLLTVIVGNAEILAERLDKDPALRRMAEMALNAAHRGAELTRRLLAFARRQPLLPVAVDVNRLVAGMDDMFRRTLGEHIHIELVRGAGLWNAFVDASQLESALLNMAINARDAMPDGGRLTIETANAHLDQAYADQHAEVRPGQYVMIAVTDTGTGMSPETIDRAFEPFYSTKAPGKGTGLGLSMVYGFVKQSNGHVKIYSEIGKGTTIRLYLPRPPADAAAPSSPQRISRGAGRVLLVEDDVAIRAFAEQALRSMGYAVETAGDGRAALDAIENGGEFDLLFTDLVMPGALTGRELATAARRLRPRLKILFTSGYGVNAAINNGHVAPGAQILHKPYRREELAAKVRAALDDGTAP